MAGCWCSRSSAAPVAVLVAGLLMAAMPTTAMPATASCTDDLIAGGGKVAEHLLALAQHIGSPDSTVASTAKLQHGKLLFEMGCAADAAEQIAAVARVDPRGGKTWWDAGIAFLQAMVQATPRPGSGGAQRRQKPGAAVHMLRNGLAALQQAADTATAPDLAIKALCTLGKTFIDAGEHSSAADAFAQADALAPGSTLDARGADLSLWGKALMNVQPTPDGVGAAAVFARAVAASPASAAAHYHTGLAALSAAAIAPLPHGRRGSSSSSSSSSSSTHSERVAAATAHLKLARDSLDRFLHLTGKAPETEQSQQQNAAALGRIAAVELVLGLASPALKVVSRLIPVGRDTTAVTNEANKPATWALWRFARSAALSQALRKRDAAGVRKVLRAEHSGMRALAKRMSKGSHGAVALGAAAAAAAARGYNELAAAAAEMAFVAQRCRPAADCPARSASAAGDTVRDADDDAALLELFAPLAAVSSTLGAGFMHLGFTTFLQDYYETCALVVRGEGAIESHAFAPMTDAGPPPSPRGAASAGAAPRRRGRAAAALGRWFTWRDVEPYLRSLQLRHGGAALASLRRGAGGGGLALLDLLSQEKQVFPGANATSSAQGEALDMHQLYQVLSGVRLGHDGAARAQPATLVLHDLQHEHSGGRRLARGLRRLLGHRVVLSAHVTPMLPPSSRNSSSAGRDGDWADPLLPPATPLAAVTALPRWEDHGVLVLQVKGARAWRVWPRHGRSAWMGSPVHKTPKKVPGQRRQRGTDAAVAAAAASAWVAQGREARETALPEAESELLLLREGDVLYLPNGIPHVEVPLPVPDSEVGDGAMSVHLRAELKIERQPDDDAGQAIRKDIAWRTALVPRLLAEDSRRQSELYAAIEDAMERESKRRSNHGTLQRLRTRRMAQQVLRDLPCASMALNAASALLRRALPPLSALTAGMCTHVAKHFLGDASMTEDAEHCREARLNADSEWRGAETFASMFDGSGATWKDALVDALLNVATNPPAHIEAASEDEDDVGLLLVALLSDPKGGAGALELAVRRVLARTQEAETSRDMQHWMQYSGGNVFHGDSAGSGAADKERFHLASLARLGSLGAAVATGGARGLRLRGRQTESGARFEAASPQEDGVVVGAVSLPEKSDGPLRLELPATDKTTVAQATAFWNAVASAKCLGITALGSCAPITGDSVGALADACSQPERLGEQDLTVVAGVDGLTVPLAAWGTLLSLGVVEPC